jgi:hypothetical protein
MPETKDIKTLYKNLKEFESAFSLLVNNEYIDSTISLENWEHGSFWINLCAGSVLGVSVIASAVWSAAVISKKVSEQRYIEQQVRSLDLKNDSLEDLVEKQREATKLLITNEAQAIVDKDMNASHDQLQRVEQSIKTLVELIQKGAQVQPALSAPESVQNLFPDFSNIAQLESKIKQIEHKK